MAASFDVMDEWRKGNVPHVVPDRPVPVREWPKVPAGPDRLRTLTSMWLSGLPTESQLALRAFMLLAYIGFYYHINSIYFYVYLFT